MTGYLELWAVCHLRGARLQIAQVANAYDVPLRIFPLHVAMMAKKYSLHFICTAPDHTQCLDSTTSQERLVHSLHILY